MGHAHQEIYLHLVWATRGREPLLVGEAERRIHRCLQSEAEKLRCVVLAVNGMPDHVHLALRVPTSPCAAQIVKQLKERRHAWQRSSSCKWRQHCRTLPGRKATACSA